MSLPFLSDIWVYPVKSLQGFPLQTAELDQYGIRYDRSCMLVDEQGKAVTQREFPQLATCTTYLDGSILSIVLPTLETFQCDLEHQPQTECFSVTIWDDNCLAVEVSSILSAKFSEFLQFPVRFVQKSFLHQRQVDVRYASSGKETIFSDGFPFHLINLASIRALFPEIPANRFRANFIINSVEPFIEDSWKKIKIGDCLFDVVKPVARCVVTTIDQKTGQKLTGTLAKEPLATLAKQRKNERSKVLFGQYLVQTNSTSVLHSGEVIEAIL